jgi:disulfide bond formation protein DsbB
MELVKLVTTSLSILTILAQIATVLGLFVYFFPGRVKQIDSIYKKLFTPYVFVIPIAAMLGSLFFSEIAHYTPCILCWYQRILMYPLALILTVAFFRKDKNAAYYAIGLSIIGGVIAAYHYLLQVKALHAIVPCSNSSVAVDCAQKVFMTFGYITIPMMALSAFLLIIVLSALRLKK